LFFVCSFVRSFVRSFFCFYVCLLEPNLSLNLASPLNCTSISTPNPHPLLPELSSPQGIVAALQCISSFPTERAIMLRERAAGTFKPALLHPTLPLYEHSTMLY
jgi:hypothetical protein